MEILVAGVSNQETKEECLKCLIQDWKQFIVTSLMENEYNEINQILNQSIITVHAQFSFEIGRSRHAASLVHSIVQRKHAVAPAASLLASNPLQNHR